MSKVIYASIVIHPIDSLVLKGIAPAPEGAKEHCHHLTLRFKPTEEQCKAIPFGRPVGMKAKGLYSNGSVAAFRMEFLEDNAPCEMQNSIPHITAWTAEGVSPAKANKMLQEQETPLVELNELVVGYVSWFDGESQEHREDNPYPAPPSIDEENMRLVEEGLRLRPWDSEYQLAYSTMRR